MSDVTSLNGKYVLIKPEALDLFISCLLASCFKCSHLFCCICSSVCNVLFKVWLIEEALKLNSSISQL